MVLLADLSRVNGNAHEDSKTGRDRIRTDDDMGAVKGAFQVKKMGFENLYFLIFGREYARYADFFESGRTEHFLEMIYERFDYFIIAAPSAFGFSKSRAFCSKVDGIVMVILSGKTRRQIAIKAKEAMEGAGGKLLGVVLNRRKHYIPQSIYKRL